MTADDNFISRWSRRKIESRAGTPPAEPPAPVSPPPGQNAAAPPAPSTAPADAAPKPLPPVESLTFDSDFTAFMQPGVDAGLRRTALKTLLHDPRFNVMDGLDVYIDDYSKPDPLPEGWLEKLNQYASLGNHEPGATPPAIEEVAEPAGEEAPPAETDVAAASGAPPAEPDDTQESDTPDAGSPPAAGGESHA